MGHLEKYKFSWEWLRDFSGFRLFRFAIWQLIEVPGGKFPSNKELYRHQNLAQRLKNSMSQLLPHIPLLAGTLVVSGVVIASGGSLLQSGVAGIATGASGFATSALVTQSQISKQRLVEKERDRLSLELENQRRLLSFGHELEHLRSLQELLQQSIDDIKQYNDSLDQDKFINPQLERNNVFDFEFVTKQGEEESIEEKNQSEGNNEVIVSFLESRSIKVKTVPTEDKLLVI